MGHDTTVFLGAKDAIINAPVVRAYLQADGAGGGADEQEANGKPISITKSETVQANSASRGDLIPGSGHNGGNDSKLNVVWGVDLDHGQVFDRPSWRKRLENEVLARVELG